MDERLFPCGLCKKPVRFSDLSEYPLFNGCRFCRPEFRVNSGLATAVVVLVALAALVFI